MTYRRFESTIINFPASPSEYRAAMERQNIEKATIKRRTAAALTAPQFDAQRRIRMWESLHGLNLPKSANHQLLDLIAKKTALTVEQVREEQVRRQAKLTVELTDPSSVPVPENP